MRLQDLKPGRRYRWVDGEVTVGTLVADSGGWLPGLVSGPRGGTSYVLVKPEFLSPIAEDQDQVRFIDQVAQAIKDAHDSLETCPNCAWNMNGEPFDPTDWDWNHHADAVLATPGMQALKQALRAIAMYQRGTQTGGEYLRTRWGLPEYLIDWVDPDADPRARRNALDENGNPYR